MVMYYRVLYAAPDPPVCYLGATVSCKEAAMLQSVFGSDGQIHIENQVSSQRFDLTTAK